MANLPDINTANVGIIAFWNAEDHKTAGVVDPTDCTGVFTSYDVYDNGLDGYITLGSGRNFNCRVKNDGWCVAWLDRTNTFHYPTKAATDFGESGHKGYYDILWNWFDGSSSISSTLTTLSYIISLFEAALETSGDFTFDAADVGHYNYEFSDANVFTILHNLADGSPSSLHSYIQYTTGTTLHYAAVVGVAHECNAEVAFASNVLATTITHVPYYGVADIISENWMPNPLIDYDLYSRIWWSGGCTTYKARGSLLILWS